MDCLCLFAALLCASFLLLTGLWLAGFFALCPCRIWNVVSWCLGKTRYEVQNLMGTFLYESKHWSASKRDLYKVAKSSD